MTESNDPRLPARFWAQVCVDSTTGCWLWVGAVSGRTGYGSYFQHKTRLAHRVAYQALVGAIPVPLVLDHVCKVRNCVNPAHLEPVTMRENILRGSGITAANARKTHCAQGHELAGDNLYIAPKNGKRGCRVCRAAAVARSQS